MFSKSWVPNGLTSMNLVFGMCSILFTFHGELEKAAICILLALVADGLDGRSARALHVSRQGNGFSLRFGFLWCGTSIFGL